MLYIFYIVYLVIPINEVFRSLNLLTTSALLSLIMTYLYMSIFSIVNSYLFDPNVWEFWLSAKKGLCELLLPGGGAINIWEF